MHDLAVVTTLVVMHEECGQAKTLDTYETVIERDSLPSDLRDKNYVAREYEMECVKCGLKLRTVIGIFPSDGHELVLGRSQDNDVGQPSTTNSGLWSRLKTWWDALE